MIYYPAAVASGYRAAEYLETDLGAWAAMNMKATATTRYSSGKLSLQGFDELSISLSVLDVGTVATAGQVKLQAIMWNNEETVELFRHDLVTLINTFLAATNNRTHFVLTLGGGKAPIRRAGDSAGTVLAAQGTISADADAFRWDGKVEFVWEITTANNAATSSTGNGRIFARCKQ